MKKSIQEKQSKTSADLSETVTPDENNQPLPSTQISTSTQTVRPGEENQPRTSARLSETVAPDVENQPRTSVRLNETVTPVEENQPRSSGPDNNDHPRDPVRLSETVEPDEENQPHTSDRTSISAGTSARVSHRFSRTLYTDDKNGPSTSARTSAFTSDRMERRSSVRFNDSVKYNEESRRTISQLFAPLVPERVHRRFSKKKVNPKPDKRPRTSPRYFARMNEITHHNQENQPQTLKSDHENHPRFSMLSNQDNRPSTSSRLSHKEETDEKNQPISFPSTRLNDKKKPQKPEQTEDEAEKRISSLLKFNQILVDFGRSEFCKVFFVVLPQIVCAWQVLAFIFLNRKYEPQCQTNTTQPCNSCKNFIYPSAEGRTSIVTEWDLICGNEFKAQIAQEIKPLGTMFGSIIFGHAADQFGRRPCYLTTCLLLVVMGILAGVTPWYWLYCISKFFLGLAVGGWKICCLVFIVEYVSVRHREIVVVMIQVSFAMGYSTLPAIAYVFRKWRDFQNLISGVGIVFITYFWILPESPHWLLLTGQIEKCAEVLQSSSRNTNIPRDELKKIVKSAYTELRIGKYRKMGGIFDLFRIKEMRKRVCVIGFAWFALILDFYGLSEYIASYGSLNIYIQIGLGAWLTLLGTGLSLPIVMHVNRRAVHLITVGLSAACLLLIPIFYDIFDSYLKNGLLLLAMALLSIAEVNLLLISTELFPTALRNSGLGFGIFSGRFGCAAALFVFEARELEERIPVGIFGGLSLLTAFLVYVLPETRGAKLTDIFQDDAEFAKWGFGEEKTDNPSVSVPAKSAIVEIV